MFRKWERQQQQQQQQQVEAALDNSGKQHQGGALLCATDIRFDGQN